MATERGWEPIEATGWVRTQGIEPRRVHESDDKVHLAGGWTRFRADDSPIISNRVLYVLTRLEQRLGHPGALRRRQLRRGRGSERSRSRQALAALALTMTTLEAGDVEAWLACFHYPLTIVGAPGTVQTLADADAMRTAFGEWAGAALPIQYEAQVIASGETGVTLAQSITRGGDSFQQAFLVARRRRRLEDAGRDRGELTHRPAPRRDPAARNALNNSPPALRGEMPKAEGGRGHHASAWLYLDKRGRPPLSLRDISPRFAGGEGIPTCAELSQGADPQSLRRGDTRPLACSSLRLAPERIGAVH